MLKLVLQTENRKLVGNPKGKAKWSPRPVAATIREVGPTCPLSCAHHPDKGKTCYALQMPLAFQARKATWSEGDGEALRKFIVSLPERWALRHNVAGDIYGPDGKVDRAYVEGMIAGHHKRPDIQGWGYTHGLRGLQEAGYTPSDFAAGGLTMNVSADTPEEVLEATRAGWPVVTTVASTDTRRRWKEGGVEYVTCPNQSMGEQGVACNLCMLCAKRDRTFVIAFRHHGSGAKRADRRLEDLTPLPMASD